tara:strand:+ start:768 stop:926 length:159 start_codon:yes stop_codon:yes gene_type:complete
LEVAEAAFDVSELEADADASAALVAAVAASMAALFWDAKAAASEAAEASTLL